MTDFRLLFSKSGALIYISHLNLTHTFIRALRRAEIPVRYSQGFNPRPKIVFALPLSVGMAGENELADISLTDPLSPDRLLERLEPVMPAGIRIKRVFPPDAKFKRILHARYRVDLPAAIDARALGGVLSSPVFVTKTDKRGEKQRRNLSPQIAGFSVSESRRQPALYLTLDASAESYLNPELVAAALCEAGLIQPDDYFITREEILFGD